MARVNTVRMSPVLNPQNDVGAFGLNVNFQLTNGVADSGDRITLVEMQRDGTIYAGSLFVAATLGASATVRLQHSNAADDAHTNLGVATTAGGASRVQNDRVMRFKKGDRISLLVGGANITAASEVHLDLLVSHDPIVNARP